MGAGGTLGGAELGGHGGTGGGLDLDPVEKEDTVRTLISKTGKKQKTVFVAGLQSQVEVATHGFGCTNREILALRIY